jgi:hypothetical protein
VFILFSASVTLICYFPLVFFGCALKFCRNTAYFEIFRKEGERNYFSDSLRAVCVVAASCSSESKSLSLPCRSCCCHCTPAGDVRFVWTDGESPAFLQIFALWAMYFLWAMYLCQLASCFLSYSVSFGGRYVQCSMYWNFVTSEVGGILSIGTATSANFEL